jgi:putative FmdB family regulatory protein|uniref:Putative regulatory protein FmdB zinc ribbon domain-containing protein n=1 Tax=Desulfobacca acetoxidans TaxID=60893 RepID=A0A7C3WRD3_9BACT
MPIYEYQCVDCGRPDQRVAGVDDHTAICIHCGGLMLRLNEDVFQPYFEEVAETVPAEKKASGSEA